MKFVNFPSIFQALMLPTYRNNKHVKQRGNRIRTSNLEIHLRECQYVQQPNAPGCQQKIPSYNAATKLSLCLHMSR